MPSILFLNRVSPPTPGATGRLLAEAASALAERGWAVTVLSCDGAADPDRPGPRATTPGTVRTIRLAAPQGRSWRAMAGQRRALGRAARALPATDVAVSMTDPPLLPIAAAGLARRGTRLVHWGQDLYPALFPLVGPDLPASTLARALRATRAALTAHHRVIAIGDCMRRRLLAHGVAPGACVTVPNWPESGLAADPAGARAWRAAWGVTTDQKLALYSGTFGRGHRFDGLLAAAARLQAEEAPIRFALVGTGGRRDELRARAAALGLANLAFPPPCTPAELPASLSAGDLHLASLEPRACGLMLPSKIAAALAVGRPCLFLGPATSDAARWLRRLGAGETVPPSDADAIAAAIRRLTARPAAPLSDPMSAPMPDPADWYGTGPERFVAEIATQAELAAHPLPLRRVAR